MPRDGIVIFFRRFFMKTLVSHWARSLPYAAGARPTVSVCILTLTVDFRIYFCPIYLSVSFKAFHAIYSGFHRLKIYCECSACSALYTSSAQGAPMLPRRETRSFRVIEVCASIFRSFLRGITDYEVDAILIVVC
jgi:hypothetical protein